jgi:hypothetical protein
MGDFSCFGQRVRIPRIGITDDSIVEKMKKKKLKKVQERNLVTSFCNHKSL